MPEADAVRITPVGIAVIRVTKEPSLENIAELQRLITEAIGQERAELYAALSNIMTGKKEGRAAMLREIYHAESLLDRINAENERRD